MGVSFLERNILYLFCVCVCVCGLTFTLHLKFVNFDFFLRVAQLGKVF